MGRMEVLPVACLFTEVSGTVGFDVLETGREDRVMIGRSKFAPTVCPDFEFLNMVCIKMIYTYKRFSTGQHPE